MKRMIVWLYLGHTSGALELAIQVFSIFARFSLRFCGFPQMETRPSHFFTSVRMALKHQASLNGLKLFVDRCLAPWRYHRYSPVGVACIWSATTKSAFSHWNFRNESDRSLFEPFLLITHLRYKRRPGKLFIMIGRYWNIAIFFV